MSQETWKEIRKLMGTRHQSTYKMKGIDGQYWGKEIGENGRFIGWVPIKVREPLGKERVCFESTAPVCRGGQFTKKMIFDSMPDPSKEAPTSKILSLSELVKPEDFSPVVVYKN